MYQHPKVLEYLINICYIGLRHTTIIYSQSGKLLKKFVQHSNTRDPVSQHNIKSHVMVYTVYTNTGVINFETLYTYVFCIDRIT